MNAGSKGRGIAPHVRGVLVAGLLALSSLAVPAMARGNWTRVEGLRPGAPTRVQVNNAGLASGQKRIAGQFKSADSNSISLRLRDGRTQTFERGLIRKVMARRPVARRYAGWIGLAATVALTWLFSAQNSKPPHPLFYGPGAGLSALGFWRQRWREVYRVPTTSNLRSYGAVAGTLPATEFLDGQDAT